MKQNLLSMAILVILCCQCALSFGQQIPFQGRLMENNAPVNDTLPIGFAIEGIAWEETHPAVIVRNGLYSVVLGSISPIPENIFDGVSQRSLTISIKGSTLTPVILYPSLSKARSSYTLDSLSINDASGRQALLFQAMQHGNPSSYIGGKGTNGNYNFQLFSNGPGNNNGNLVLHDATGHDKVWLNAHYHSTGTAGLLSLRGPSSGRIVSGFKNWEAENNINLPYISMEGNTENEARVWMSVNRNEAGTEFGTLTFSSTDGKSLHLDAYTQLGIPSRGPNSENFLMSGKTWENKPDYPVFDLKGTINSQADGQGYTLPLISLVTNDNAESEWGSLAINSGKIGGTSTENKVWMSVDRNEAGTEFGSLTLSSGDGKSLHLNAYTQLGIPSRGPNSENFLMTGKTWEDKPDYPIFELRGTINSAADGSGYTLPLTYMGTADNGVLEWGNMGINAGVIGSNETRNLVEMNVRQTQHGTSGQAYFRGLNSDNIHIGSSDWAEGGADRGEIRLFGNSIRTNDQGGSWNPALYTIHVLHDGTQETGAMRIENQQGNVNVDLNAAHDGIIVVKNGTGANVTLTGNGDLNASRNITAAQVNQTSDRRYKEQIEDLMTPLEKVMMLRGVSYYWKDKSKSEARQIGLIAQEVEAIYPEFVHTNADGYKSVNYASMVAVLIESVKELQQKIDNLEQDKQQLLSENATLKTELQTGMEALYQRMSQLEQLMGQQTLKAAATQASAETRGE